MATDTAQASASEKISCSICMEEASASSLIATCEEHEICLTCLKETFERAMQHEYHYPPNCCGPAFPLQVEDYTSILGEHFKDRFLEKQVEYRTPHTTRTYCSSADCGKFLPKASNDENSTFATCPSCNVETCISCKGTAADPQTHTCQESEEDENAILYSHTQGWKQCPSCHGLVELREACNHITCERCNYEFCFVCLTAFPCQYSCPHYGPRAVFDDGYDDQGFHFASGLDREGFDRDGFDKTGRDAAGRPRPPGWNAMRARDRHRDNEEHGGLELTREDHELARNIQRIIDLENGIIHDGEIDRFEQARQEGRDLDDEEGGTGEDEESDSDDEGEEDEDEEGESIVIQPLGHDDDAEEDGDSGDEGDAMDWVPDNHGSAHQQ